METLTQPELVTPKPPAPSQPNLAGSIGKNTLFGIFSSIVQVATRLVTVPIVLAHLGLDGYGIWSIIMNAATYMRFGSVGIKSAFQKYVAEATGTGDYETTSKLLSTGSLIMAILSVIGLVPTAIYSRQIAHASGIPEKFLSSSAWSITVLAVIMLLSNSGAAFEAIVMGGHRIDLTRKFSTICFIFEAIGFVAVLELGWGLFAMASIMAASDLGFLIACYVSSRRILPQIHVHLEYVAKSVIKELVRFAGSYQVLSLLQIIYLTLSPIVILRSFGANATGVLAVAGRLTTPINMCMTAFLLPILSGGAMVYGIGTSEKMQGLLTKSFKVALGLTLVPLTLISFFGTYVIEAWTGQTDPGFQTALWLVCLSMLFQSFAQLGLVLYRVSGRAVMDNIREVLRIVCFLPIMFLATQMGFRGVLIGMVAVEFVGMLFMFYALAQTFPGFHASSMIPEALKLSAATVAIVAAAALCIHLVPTSIGSDRMVATVRVGALLMGIIVATVPALYLTRSLSKSEFQSILHAFKTKGSAGIPTSE